MSIENLTCYYYSIFIVGAVITAVRPMSAVPLLVASGLVKLFHTLRQAFIGATTAWSPKATSTSPSRLSC